MVASRYRSVHVGISGLIDARRHAVSRTMIATKFARLCEQHRLCPRANGELRRLMFCHSNENDSSGDILLRAEP